MPTPTQVQLFLITSCTPGRAVRLTETHNLVVDIALGIGTVWMHRDQPKREGRSVRLRRKTTALVKIQAMDEARTMGV